MEVGKPVTWVLVPDPAASRKKIKNWKSRPQGQWRPRARHPLGPDNSGRIGTRSPRQTAPYANVRAAGWQRLRLRLRGPDAPPVRPATNSGQKQKAREDLREAALDLSHGCQTRYRNPLQLPLHRVPTAFLGMVLNP